jgi:hypothetical protein
MNLQKARMQHTSPNELLRGGLKREQGKGEAGQKPHVQEPIVGVPQRIRMVDLGGL